MSTMLHEPETETGTAPLVLHFKPVLNLSENEFFAFCQINRDLRIERTALGEIIVMAPAGFDSSGGNLELLRQLANWALQDRSGVARDSSCGYTLPNGSVRSPDASWVSNERLKLLTKKQRQKFAPLCPEFVVELRSPSDRISDLKAKMEEYIENGALLGLLIVPEKKRVYVYRPNQSVEQLDHCETVSCEPVLPGFELMLQEIC